MKRPVIIVGVLLALCGVGVGSWAYVTHHEIRQTGKAVYKALEDDGTPLEPGILDDPIFQHLPPSKEPVSLGRYQPPKAVDTPTPPKRAPVVATQGTRVAVSPVPVQVTGKQPEINQIHPGPFLQPADDRPLAQQKIHVLLIGNDQAVLGKGRGDTLLTLTFDPKAHTLYFLSIPRDTRVNLPGYGTVKINAAYTYGGASLQTTAIERFLGIPFDKYVEVSLNGFVQALDAVGGVDVNSVRAFKLNGQKINIGPQHLAGEAALVYARMRHDDPDGDLGRNKRQQEVLRALIKSLGRLNSRQLTNVILQLSASVRTDFSPSEIVKLRAAHSYMLDHQTSLVVQGTNRKIGGIWYYLVSARERQRLYLLLR